MMQTLQSNAFETLVVEFKKYLALQVPSELAVVFLTGSDCKYCVEMREVIDRVMPRYIGKVQFFTVNLSENKSVVSKAEGSVYQEDGSDASIQHVPVVIFYRKQMPIARFKGQYNEHDFAQFIASAIEGSVPAYAPPPSYAPPPPAAAMYPVEQQPVAAYQQPYTYQQQQPPQQYQQQQQQQQQHYQPTAAAPAKLQQSYYNTPYRQPPLQQQQQQHQQDLYNRPPGGAAADNAPSIENCSGRKFCYSTYANAYNSC